MTRLVHELRKQVQVVKPIQTPNVSGSFTRSYETLLTVWMGMKALSHATYIRGVQADIEAGKFTHEFKCRKEAVDRLNSEFTAAYTSAFDIMGDLMPLKSDYFLLVEKGSTVKGRLFRIKRIMDKDERGEYLSLLTEEIEEKGTGYAD